MDYGYENRNLLAFEKPGRYVDGELGICPPDTAAALRVCVCFPDLYEVGMSNHSIRILYSRMNEIDDVSCERVFSPALDLEAGLRKENEPLRSLESRTPLKDFDIIAFSIGFELLATNVLAILETGGVPLHRDNRGGSDPVVIAGGPGITNPLPFGDFFDAVLIGEAEEELEKVMTACRDKNRSGAGRSQILQVFRSSPHWWYSGKGEKTFLHTWKDFGRDAQSLRYYPVSNIKSVQDHGVLEIMRGCPNGCRFCHAGYFYRPCREKNIDSIVEEARNLVDMRGYREITLASLSSGDYSRLWPLLECLNREFSGSGVSFSLPSLRIDTFSLEHLEQLSIVRKSGLTFAVESPNPKIQRGINKSIDKEHIIELIKKAKNLGWKQAKFYFMIGLPGFEEVDEGAEITAFLSDIFSATKMNLNVNIGTFVPKPHTPFQSEPQMDHNRALETIYSIRDALRGRQFKIAYHSPFLSHIEGIIARGDREVSKLIFDVYKRGARFDAWEELFRREVWSDALSAYFSRYSGKRGNIPRGERPWDGISFKIHSNFLDSEREKGRSGVLTPGCSDDCEDPGGRCGAGTELRKASSAEYTTPGDRTAEKSAQDAEEIYKYVFSFSKTGPAIFLSHLNCMTVFERSFLRAGVDLSFSAGFNPKPKLEFAHPLMLGLASFDEIAGFQSNTEYLMDRSFVDELNKVLPRGFKVLRARKKQLRKSLMSNFKGGRYRIDGDTEKIYGVSEKVGKYADKEPGIISDLDESAINEKGELFFTMKHEGKAGNLKTLLSHITGNDDFTDFLITHPVTRIRSFTADKKGRLVPFLGE